MFKKCKVAMLPTEEIEANGKQIYSGKVLGGKTKLYFPNSGEEARILKHFGFKPQNLYVLLEDNIVEGDWVIPNDFEYANRPWQFKQDPRPLPFWGCKYNCKKIIATTDNLEVEEYGFIFPVPKLSDSFIQKFVESNGKINEIMVEFYPKDERQHCLVAKKVDELFDDY